MHGGSYVQGSLVWVQACSRLYYLCNVQQTIYRRKSLSINKKLLLLSSHLINHRKKNQFYHGFYSEISIFRFLSARADNPAEVDYKKSAFHVDHQPPQIYKESIWPMILQELFMARWKKKKGPGDKICASRSKTLPLWWFCKSHQNDHFQFTFCKEFFMILYMHISYGQVYIGS